MKVVRRKYVELYLVPALILVLLLVPHVLFLRNYYVDLEPIYVDAAAGIAEHGLKADLSGYFDRIPNPVFTLLALSAGYSVFGESPLVSRLVILLFSVAFSFFLYFYLRKRQDFFIAFIASVLFVVNPLFIVYSQYVHSDVPFMIFSSVAMLFFFFAVSSREKVWSSVFLGISLATKYVTVILYPVVVLYSVMKCRVLKSFSKKNVLTIIKFNLWYFVVSLLVALPLILSAYLFDGSLVSSSFSADHSLDLQLFFSHFFSYLLWLGLFIGPFFLAVLWDASKKMGGRTVLVALAVTFVFTLVMSFIFPISSLHRQEGKFGEMNLGWVESVVPSFYLSIVFFFVVFVAEFFIVCLAYDMKRDEWARKLFLWIVIPILIMSLTRAANRYMLVVVVPISLYFAFVAKRVYSRKTKMLFIALIVLHILIFVAVGFFSNYYLHQRGIEALAAAVQK